MGMFDHVVIHESIPLPCKKRPQGLQTKDLANELAIYVVTRFGRLVEERNNTDQNYHGKLSVIGSTEKKFTSGSKVIMLDMYFQNGFLIYSQEKVYTEMTETDYGEPVKCNIPLWKKLWRIVLIVKWELKMIFNPPERDANYVIPEKDETILF